MSVSENWGFGCFITDQYKLVVDEDALEPCHLFSLLDDPNEDDDRLGDPTCKAAIDDLMETVVRPFLRTPPARPHKSVFTP